LTAHQPLLIQAGKLRLPNLRRVARDSAAIAIDEGDLSRVDLCRAFLDKVIAEKRTIYGVNTGFGKLATTSIVPGELATLQRNLIMSHCTGTGPELGSGPVRLALAMKANALARGHSGVRRLIVTILCDLLRYDIRPCVPAKGSVGASGDLTPLAHLVSPLIGMGEAVHEGRRLAGGDALAIAGHAPVELAPKEGLALINGTQISTAMALDALFAAENAFAAALVAGAMSLEAAFGSAVPFDARIHDLRGHLGQMDVAAAFRALFEGSAIMAAHGSRHRVQDPYSMRCQPQVLGACLDTMRFAARTLEIEANAVSDNPIVFAEDGDVLSGGNFHAEPVAIAADLLAIALAEVGALAERRIAFLVDSSLSGLPPFLVEGSGLNSGLMVAQITAAALASENKTLAHPASVDNIPTAANQEDHVSMAAFAARRLAEIADNVTAILAIEMIAAAQGLDFRRPLTSSPVLESALALVREQVEHIDRDRPLAGDIALMKGAIVAGTFRRFVPGALLEPQGP